VIKLYFTVRFSVFALQFLFKILENRISDICLIRVLTLSGKNKEWPIWSEKFLSKAKRSQHKDLLLGKIKTPKSEVEINGKPEEDKALLKIADLRFEWDGVHRVVTLNWHMK
jgi:hypothetical protein